MEETPQTGEQTFQPESKVVNGVDVRALGRAIHEFRKNPDLGEFRFRARNHWQSRGFSHTTIDGYFGAGEERKSLTRPFTLVADEPDVLLGADVGPNPVEHLINALVTCLTSAMAYHAASRGLVIEELDSEIEGELDVRGFLGIAPDVRKGYRNIKVTFHVKSDASPEELEACARFSPVLDTITKGTNVDLSVQKR